MANEVAKTIEFGSNTYDLGVQQGEFEDLQEKVATLSSKVDDMGLSVVDGNLCITFNN